MKALSWSSAFLATVVGATAVPAQTLPLPTLPPEEAADSAPSSTTSAAAATGGTSETGRPPRWHYRLGLGAGYDSNINFRLPDGPSSWAVYPRGAVGVVLPRSRGEIRLAAEGDWVGYQDYRDLSHYSAGASAGGSYRSSLETTWRAEGSYHLGYSDRSRILSDQGVLLPLVKTRTTAGTLGVERALGLRTSFNLDGRVYYMQFDQQQAGAGLQDGVSVRGTSRLERQLDANDRLGLQYALEATNSRRTPEGTGGDGPGYYLTHFGSLQWSHVLGARSAFMLEAGGSHTPESTRAGLGRRTYFYGGASYSHRFRRASFTAFARREVTPAFGLGVSRVENRFGLSVGATLGRAWSFHAMATHVVPETPEDARVTYAHPDQASASLARSIGRRLQVSAEGRYRRRGATGTFPAIEGFQVGVFLSFVDSPGRAGSDSPQMSRR